MRILAVKLSSLGDLFHALPAVHNLKGALQAEVDWVTQEEYVPLVKCFEDVTRVIAFPRRTFWSQARPFLRELRAREYDYVIDFQGLLKSAMIVQWARGRRKIGPSFSREGARFLYAEMAGKKNRDRHAVEQNLDVIRHLKLERVKPVFPVRFPVKPLSQKRPKVAIVPVSRWPTKTWPPLCFIETARRLRQVADPSFFLIGGAQDRGVCERIERELGGSVVNRAGRSDLVETGSLLKEMDLVLANDSGPVHMATAIGTRTLVVFGPTDPVRTGPYGDGHRVIRTSLPCQPCFSRVCHKPGIPCLSGVTPEKVAEAAVAMLSSPPSP